MRVARYLERSPKGKWETQEATGLDETFTDMPCLGFSIADFYSRDNDGFCCCANSVNQAELVIFFVASI